MPPECRAKVREASGIAGANAFNVVKFQDDKISLLLYEDFDSAAFPALLEAHTINLSKGSVTRSVYRGSDNPPILHRKELLLLPNDPRRDMFASLTKSLEELGLFENTSDIGHCQRPIWKTQVVRPRKARAGSLPTTARIRLPTPASVGLRATKWL